MGRAKKFTDKELKMIANAAIYDIEGKGLLFSKIGNNLIWEYVCHLKDINKDEAIKKLRLSDHTYDQTQLEELYERIITKYELSDAYKEATQEALNERKKLQETFFDNSQRKKGVTNRLYTRFNAKSFYEINKENIKEALLELENKFNALLDTNFELNQKIKKYENETYHSESVSELLLQIDNLKKEKKETTDDNIQLINTLKSYENLLKSLNEKAALIVINDCNMDRVSLREYEAKYTLAKELTYLKEELEKDEEEFRREMFHLVKKDGEE